MQRLSHGYRLILRATTGSANLEFTTFTDLEVLPKYLQEVRNFAPENPCSREGYLNSQVLQKKESTDQNQDIPLLPPTGGSGSAPAHKPYEVPVVTDPRT
ncbi:hypothetical protein llap_1989 [Limosa lapponica baueri]|uniref:Uncharacterized protein n=1 Tax=Limosa lapponica baueri TaxID=1758121 RepID=A0A2I0UNT2_LIMLA|nr:hypothetical protein llap_1989 [Limosa lapponica baueri]